MQKIGRGDQVNIEEAKEKWSGKMVESGERWKLAGVLSDAILHLETDIKEAKTGIERDEQLIRLLKEAVE
jgi:hypothetical protein